MRFFLLGSVDPLLVEVFEGFDRPQTATLVGLLSNGTSIRDAVLQQGETPFLQAQLTGVLTEAAHLAAMRAYYLSKEPVTFTDGNGNQTDVRVFEFRHTDLTDWWTFQATLIESDVPVSIAPGPARLVLSGVAPTVT